MGRKWGGHSELVLLSLCILSRVITCLWCGFLCAGGEDGGTEGWALADYTSSPCWWPSWQAASRTGSGSQFLLSCSWDEFLLSPGCFSLLTQLPPSTAVIWSVRSKAMHALSRVLSQFQKWLSGTHGCWLLIALRSLKIGFSAVEAGRAMCPTLLVGSLTDCPSWPSARLPGCGEVGGKRID